MKSDARDPVGAAPMTVRVANLPNALTAVRILCVPLIAWLLWIDSGTNGVARDAAALVFVLASLTDVADGAIARRYGLITTFGKVADPIADKALTGVALIGLSLLSELPWWVTIVIIGREVVVTVLRFAVIKDGVIPASRGGKAKTVSQMVAITLYILPLTGPWLTVRTIVMGVAVVLTVATGIDYAGRALAVRRRGDLVREAFREP